MKKSIFWSHLLVFFLLLIYQQKYLSSEILLTNENIQKKHFKMVQEESGLFKVLSFLVYFILFSLLCTVLYSGPISNYVNHGTTFIEEEVTFEPGHYDKNIFKSII